MWPHRISETAAQNLARIRQIHEEAERDDAETLARIFEDPGIRSPDGAAGRIGALLDATAHRWLPGRSCFLDVPGLHELSGFSDRGFRTDLRDPWPVSRDQVGHVLTALALFLRPGIVRAKRFGFTLRRLGGADPELSDDEVALRFAIGHEKTSDPGRYDPLMLLKVRRQYRSATTADVHAFREAVRGQVGASLVDLAQLRGDLTSVAVGHGTGNSPQDLTLTALGALLAEDIRSGAISRREDVAAWVRSNLAG